MSLSRQGRFAPSPTGPLHLGSLTTALASWLDAQANGYRWLVRIEDIDAPREQPGAAAMILHQLATHGLKWDDWPHGSAPNGVLYQSQRTPAYEQTLIGLISKGLAYPCSCSRKRLQIAMEHGKAQKNPDGEILYPGFCTPRQPQAQPQEHAWRYFQEHDGPQIAWRLRSGSGDDFVLRRSDGLWAYNFAVVVDDAFQGITHIVRGDDLLYAAPRHATLRQALGAPHPELIHVPVVRNEQGEKLSKQTKAPMLRTDSPELIALQLQCAYSHLQLVMNPRWVARVDAAWQRLLQQASHGLTRPAHI